MRRSEQGQSVMEVIVALAIFVLIAAALASLALGGFDALSRGGDYERAAELAEEGLEGVRAVRNGAWNELLFNQSAVAHSAGYWQLVGEGTTEIFGKFTRTINFQIPCRDESGALSTCPSGTPDKESRLVESLVAWSGLLGLTGEVRRETLLSNWDSQNWVQTDWSGGPGNEEWQDETAYESDDGGVDRSIAGELRLRSLGGASASANAGFDNGTASWTFAVWDRENGEINPLGSWRSFGGNPNGYAEVMIPANAAGDTIGAYWQQAIELDGTEADFVCSADWRIFNWRVAGNQVNEFEFLIFLDQTSGAPARGNELWSSGTVGGLSPWTPSGEVDCQGAVTGPGTYYLKLAVWLEAQPSRTGPIIVGFDNARLAWAGANYETAGELISSAFDLTDPSPVQIVEWDEELPACDPACLVRLNLRTAPDLASLPAASWSDDLLESSGELVDPSLNGGRFVQYRVSLEGDGGATPVLREVRLNYK